MEDKTEVNPPELNRKDYETFFKKCQLSAIRLVATEAPKDSVHLISNTLEDEFEPGLEEMSQDVAKVKDLLEDRLHKLGVETIPENPRDLDDVSLSSLGYDHRACDLTIREEPDFLQTAVTELGDLDERTTQRDFGPFTQAHPFFQTIGRIKNDIGDYIDIMNRRSSEIDLPKGAQKRAEKLKAIAEKIEHYQIAIFSSLPIWEESGKNPNYVEENSTMISPIMLPLAISVTNTITDEEVTTELNRKINGILNTWD